MCRGAVEWGAFVKAACCGAIRQAQRSRRTNELSQIERRVEAGVYKAESSLG